MFCFRGRRRSSSWAESMKTLEMMKQGKGRMMRIRSWWRAVVSGGDKQGSKVVSPAATAYLWLAATGWSLPAYSPKLPTYSNMSNDQGVPKNPDSLAIFWYFWGMGGWKGRFQNLFVYLFVCLWVALSCPKLLIKWPRANIVTPHHWCCAQWRYQELDPAFVKNSSKILNSGKNYQEKSLNEFSLILDCCLVKKRYLGRMKPFEWRDEHF